MATVKDAARLTGVAGMEPVAVTDVRSSAPRPRGAQRTRAL